MQLFAVFVGDYEESTCYGVAKWQSSIEEFTLDCGVVPEHWVLGKGLAA
jgi:hypothetical protein